MVDDRVVEIIANNMPQLRHLWLTKASITDDAADSLRKLRQLHVLSIGRTDTGNALAAAVSSMPELRSLSLDYTRITAELVAHLAALPHLRTLKLTGCIEFGDDGLRALASVESLQHSLQALHIGGLNTTDAAVPSLQQLAALESLQLWETSVTSIGARQLVRPDRLVIDDQIRCAEGTWILIHPRRLHGM